MHQLRRGPSISTTRSASIAVCDRATDPRAFAMRAIEIEEPSHDHLCANAEHEACNWLVVDGDDEQFCLACRHNSTIPDISVPENLINWRRIEDAKRHLFYSINPLAACPEPTRREDPRAGPRLRVPPSDQTGPDGTTTKFSRGTPMVSSNDQQIAEGDECRARASANRDAGAYATPTRGNSRLRYRSIDKLDRLVRGRRQAGGFSGDLRRRSGKITARRSPGATNERTGRRGLAAAPHQFLTRTAHPWEDLLPKPSPHFVHIRRHAGDGARPGALQLTFGHMTEEGSRPNRMRDVDQMPAGLVPMDARHQRHHPLDGTARYLSLRAAAARRRQAGLHRGIVVSDDRCGA